ncbi:hypothetical protein MRX96_047130 [Rhipicephalus microplus]
MVWMATQDRTGPGATRRSTTGDHRRGHVVIPPILLRTAGLPPPVETMVRCCRGQYFHSILTALATTAKPVQKHDMIPLKLQRFCYDIELEVAWDEQLLKLCLLTHCAQLKLLQDRLEATWRAYDVTSSCCVTSPEELFLCVGNADHGVMQQRHRSSTPSWLEQHGPGASAYCCGQ